MFCVTFYSFKGGVGRTMALINIAILLAKKNKKVLIVDFDLEAPGISSYASFREVDCSVGLVDVVDRYAQTGRAENINDYLQRAQIDGRDIWVLPAGNHSSPDYGPRFSRIDWNHLYQEKHGFLFFEDLRQQWESAGFDYVLIDSRTGHTDTAGICTRQLPDLVVSFFVPTDQNIRGLSPILSEMIDSSPVKLRRVEHIVCASNVPDVDDEEGIVATQLALAKDLFPAEISRNQGEIPVLNHYASMEMLHQREFVVSRPNSRLALQYRQLYEAIIRHNLSDREGAISRLNSTLLRLEPSNSNWVRRGQEEKDDDTIFELLSEVRSLHEDDGEIEFLCARIARLIGEIDTEILSLSAAISKGYGVTAARLNRSYAYALTDEKEKAARDLIDVAHGAHSSALEIRAAISQLRSLFAETWLDRIIGGVTTVNASSSFFGVTAYEATRERGLAIRFDDFLEQVFGSSQDEGLLSLPEIDNVVLLKISALRPVEALQIIEAQGRELRVQDHFNAGVARWMISGSPSRNDFSRVLEMATGIKDKSANVVQCLMLACSVVEDPDRRRLVTAELLKRLPVSGWHFSCDTYLLSPASTMAQTLSRYRRSLQEGQEIIPQIVDEYRENLPEHCRS